jgi:hypothetical protein
MLEERDHREKSEPSWRAFEQAVAHFVSALDPSARVEHDARMPDGDTGARRQRDVWVEGKLCGLFPIKVLISCKRYKRVLNESDIDHFLGELASSGAHKGVIYSHSGFNSKALEKAKKRGVSCMRLYQDEAPEIPEVLVISHAYCCYPRFVLALLWKHDPRGQLLTWSDLLNRPTGETDTNRKLIDFISVTFRDFQTTSLQKSHSDGEFPRDWTYECTFEDPDDPDIRARIRFAEVWRIFEAKLEAYNVNGSYSFTEKQFVGRITTPFIDTWSSEPGPGWTLLGERPNSLKPRVTLILARGEMHDVIIDHLGDSPLQAS